MPKSQTIDIAQAHRDNEPTLIAHVTVAYELIPAVNSEKPQLEQAKPLKPSKLELEVKQLQQQSKTAPLKESKLEAQLKKAIESSKGAIMEEVKNGMPNVTLEAKPVLVEKSQAVKVEQVKAVAVEKVPEVKAAPA